MKIYCKGTARIRHGETGKTHEIESDELEWDEIGSEERQMGPEIHYQATVNHLQLGVLTWEVWEYPIGIENFRETNAGPNQVIKNFDYGLMPDDPNSYEWVDYSVPDNPFTIFMSSYHHTGDLLADHGSDSDDYLVNRLIFSHQITAMEAYLADRLIKEVEANGDIFQRLLDQNEDLAKEKFTLVEISKDPTLVERKVREHLRAILYHNLPKVDALYSIAFGFHILNLAKDKQRLFKAVMLRHDCVHRNGFDKDGNELKIFSKTFVQDTADMVKTFVEDVERSLRAQASTSKVLA